MKGRVIVLDMPKDRPFAAALMIDGRLEDLILDPPKGSAQTSSGDIRVVRVKRKLPKAGAFCEMADGREGYLRDAKNIREGERLLVQVISLPEPGKAVALTTRLLFKGPRLILTPDAPGVNVSRKIGNEAERERLQQAVSAALADAFPETGRVGVIVRSAARGEELDGLRRELLALSSRWQSATARLSTDRAEEFGSKGMTLPDALREWLFPVPREILCGPRIAETLSAAHEEFGPTWSYGDERFLPLLRPEHDPFEATGLHDVIEALRSPEVSLDGGASLVIEPTRALVAVDVNTGADFSPAAGLKANLAAARELPRQFRLRGLGGQIAVDFAPMPKPQRRGLEETLKKAFRDDPVETSFVGWTALGLYEMQRKRERRPLTELF